MFYILTKEDFDCKYCKQAERLIREDHGDDSVKTIPLPRDVLLGLGFRTVPQVFHGEKPIGGYQETVTYLFNLKHPETV